MPSSEVMGKWKAGSLHSGSKNGPVVKNQKQAIAIMLSEKRAEGQHGGKYPHRQDGGSAPVLDLTDNAHAAGVHYGTMQPGVIPSYLTIEAATRYNRPQEREAFINGFKSVTSKRYGGAATHKQFGGPQRAEGQHGGKYPERKGYDIGGSPTMPQGCAPGLMQHQPEQPFPGHFGLNPAQSGMNPFGMAGMPSLAGQMFGGLGGHVGQQRQLHQAANGGGVGGYQFGGSPTSMGLTPGWIERQEARNISHTGPIISAVGGRTDHHSINVPSGSYVLPAAHVSAMGQGNTLNGMKILQGMFGPPMKMPHGSGPPRMHAPPSLMPKTQGLGGLGMMADGGNAPPPPPLPIEPDIKAPDYVPESQRADWIKSRRQILEYMRPPKDRGGSRGDNTGRPVPIMAAGGEFVLSPDQVAKVGKGNLDHGHAILDHWVKKTHKKYAKTVANLPPPAKT